MSFRQLDKNKKTGFLCMEAVFCTNCNIKLIVPIVVLAQVYLRFLRMMNEQHPTAAAITAMMMITRGSVLEEDDGILKLVLL